ncbi:hypothetical protein [Conchiformibius kuhniae]|uniref:Uncharacterized protein n=1 Tax=Conchiformibius kuhniae TaxID=211502 RepID=A0A8T9MUP4_9NEIS|nr:hypothetical protein [Conchiformibius kuhniae]UOP04999.1 hypothetical protein LVJ77_01345 [Conchiformibius kuhniae]
MNPLVRGWRHLSVLDGRTSGVCLRRHGLLWNKKKEAIGHDVPFARPPLHPNCRSSLVFVFDSDAPFDGMTGADWVRSRSAAQLRGQFGEGIGQMLYDGVITLADAVSADGLKPLTLAQLQQQTRFSFVGRKQEYHLGGRVLSRWDLAELSGAADGSEISFVEYPEATAMYRTPALKIIVANADVYDVPMHRAILLQADGSLILRNESQYLLAEQQGKGIATEALKQQIIAARKLGIERIETYAVRGETENGYYTWARLGFDGDLTADILNRLPDDLHHAKRVSDLMQTERGREWWKRNGKTINLAFDLQNNSLSIRMFRHYLSSKRAS